MGTGTSQGVPIIGCQCGVCRSDDPRDARLRASALVEYGGLNILVDAGPDFRTQMVRAGVRHLDAILLTHNHMDHIGGLDDVRALNYIDRKPAYIYCEQKVLESLKIMYSYAFAEVKYPGAPEWRIRLIDDRPFIVEPNDSGDLVWMHDQGYCTRMPDGSIIPCGNDIVSHARPAACHPSALSPASCPSLSPDFSHSISPASATALSPDSIPSLAQDSATALSPENGVTIIPIRGYHDRMPVLGFRFGDIAYITDISRLADGEEDKLKGLKHLTLNTVSYHPHHSHLSLDEAVALARKIGAEHTWLTHLSHTFPRYDEFAAQLPEGIAPAYDGLTITD